MTTPLGRDVRAEATLEAAAAASTEEEAHRGLAEEPMAVVVYTVPSTALKRREYPGWGESAEQAWAGVGMSNGQGILTRPFISGGWTWTGYVGSSRRYLKNCSFPAHPSYFKP